MDKLSQYLRTDDWLDSKVPFMLGVFLFAALFREPPEHSARLYAELLAYTLYISMFLAFSYVINDFTDLDVDRAAGKHKVMFSLPKPLILASMAVIVLLGCTPMYVLVENKALYLGLTVLLYLSGAAYSVPCLLRFKERGLAGLLECSVAQRCFPLIFILFLCPAPVGELALILLLTFVNGLRYILIHQAIDCETDRRTGVKTFVSEGCVPYRKLIKTALLTEIALFAVLLLKLCLLYPSVLAFALGYCVFERIVAVVVVRYMDADWLCSFLAVPLEDLYNVFFPALMACLLARTNPVYLGVLALLLPLTANCFRGKFAFVSVYIKSKRERKN